MVDALGNPIHVQRSSGDIHDENIAEDVLNHVELDGTIVQADKAYGPYCLRKYIANRNADFCIPPKSNTVDPWYCDWVQYKERHLVECFFNKLKENRRIATRFDKLASRCKSQALFLQKSSKILLGSSLSSILVVFGFYLLDYSSDPNLETHPSKAV